MTAPVRTRILAEIERRLTGLTLASVPVTIYADRDEPVSTFPSIVLQSGGQKTLDEGMAYDAFLAEPSLHVFAQDTTPKDARIATDLLMATVLQAVFSDSILVEQGTGARLALDLRKGEELATECEQMPNKKPTGAAATTIQVEFWTLPRDPFTPFALG